MLEDQIYLTAVRDEASLMAATPATDLDRRVPGCPDWDVAQLIGHTGWIHRWVTAILANGGERVSPRDVAPAPEGAAVLEWFAEATPDLLRQLEALDPDAEAFTFVGPRPARFWRRRMAQETAVHRWDAQSASTRPPTPLDAALAVDGIDEVWDVYFPRRFTWDAVADGATVHLHATDVEGEWLVRVGADEATSTVTRGHAKGDVAVRGTASDLLLYLFGRISPADLDLRGDAELAAAFQAGGRY